MAGVFQLQRYIDAALATLEELGELHLERCIDAALAALEELGELLGELHLERCIDAALAALEELGLEFPIHQTAPPMRDVDGVRRCSWKRCEKGNDKGR